MMEPMTRYATTIAIMLTSHFRRQALTCAAGPIMRRLLLVCTAMVVWSDATKSVKVFGTGLSKTGTTSLAGALTELGYDTIHTDIAFIPIMLTHDAVSRTLCTLC